MNVEQTFADGGELLDSLDKDDIVTKFTDAHHEVLRGFNARRDVCNLCLHTVHITDVCCHSKMCSSLNHIRWL